MIRRLIAGFCALLLVLQPAAAQYRPGGFVGGPRSGLQFTTSAGGFPSPGAIFDADWKNNRYAGPPISVSNATGGYIDDSNGNWSFVPPNTARRSDKGLLVEGQQTNSIRNNSMQGVVASTLTNALRNNAMVGAVAGQSQNAIPNNTAQGAVAGSPGSQPTGWSMATVSTGLSRQIVGTGIESGVDYIDVRYSGTTTNALSGSSFTYFVGGSSVAAVAGQTWTASAYTYVVGGSSANVSLTFGVTEHDSGGSPVAASSTSAVSATSGPLPSQRLVVTRTLSNANTAFVSERLQLSAASGVAIDFTLRIGLPQLEQASGAGPVTKTYGTAAAFAAGTMPNNWTGALTAGLSRQVVGTGTDAGTGYPYLDVRFFGVPTQAGSNFPSIVQYDGASVQPAAAGQTWTLSQYAALIGGSLGNVQTTSTEMYEANAAGQYLTEGGTPFTPNATLTRQSYTRTLSNANTANVWGGLRMAFTTAGTGVDLTVRIAVPQLEPNATAGTVQQTSGFASWTPGTLPPFVAASSNTGLSRQIVGTGVQNGVEHIDVRIYGYGVGTASNLALNILFDNGNTITATQGQLWTNSAFISVVAGAFPPITTGVGAPKLVIAETNSSGGNVAYDTTNLSLTGSLTRFVFNQTLGGSGVAYIQPGMWVYGPTTVGQPVDFTIRVGWPQLEQWQTNVTTIGGASSPIRTANGAATRAADVATFNASTFNGLQGTMAVVARPGNFVASSGLFAVLSTPGNTSGQVQFRSRGQPNQGATAISSDNGAFFLASGSTSEVVAGTRFAAASAWQANDTAISSGGLILTSNATTTPQAVIGTGYIGSGPGGSSFGGYFERLIIRPDRAANSNLQPLGSVANY